MWPSPSRDCAWAVSGVHPSPPYFQIIQENEIGIITSPAVAVRAPPYGRYICGAAACQRSQVMTIKHSRGGPENYYYEGVFCNGCASIFCCGVLSMVLMLLQSLLLGYVPKHDWLVSLQHHAKRL
jgi:hypothetical protein